MKRTSSRKSNAAECSFHEQEKERGMMQTLEHIQNALLPILEQESVFRAVVFGSYAKGMADEHSDIDLVIDSRGKLKGFAFYRLLDLLSDAVDAPLDVIEVSEIVPHSEVSEIIEKEGVVIYDRTLP